MKLDYFKALVFPFVILIFGLPFIISCSDSVNKNSNTSHSKAEEKFDPFADNNGHFPDKKDYDLPFYEGNFNYPTTIDSSITYKWQEVLNGQKLSKETAKEYMEAVHDFIQEDMRVMVNEPQKWIHSENKKNWYNMAWAGQSFKKTGWEGAEALSGTLTGQVLRKGVFSEYGFDGPMQNHVTVYYNKTAAHTLYKLWKEKDTTGYFPTYSTEAAQYAQNSIVIKAAATDVSPDQWDALKGTGKLPVYRPIVHGPNKSEKPVVQSLNWIQFDIIIKDTIAAPETGWVFATYIYDANSPGKTTFDRMTLQGAMWGMDPNQMDTSKPLEETYINPDAPKYGFANLGYGNRLSGPIDVAKVGGEHADGTVKKIFVLNENDGVEGGQTHDMYRASSCLSCHSTAAYPYQNDFYPSPKLKLVYTDTIFHPKSEGWKLYNTNRSGNEIMPPASGKVHSYMALDYDLFVFFALTNSGQMAYLTPEEKPLPPKNYNPEWLKKESHPLFH